MTKDLSRIVLIWKCGWLRAGKIFRLREILERKLSTDGIRAEGGGVTWMSQHLTFTLCFGRDLVDLNVLHRSNVALKTPDQVGTGFLYWTTLNS